MPDLPKAWGLLARITFACVPPMFGVLIASVVWVNGAINRHEMSIAVFGEWKLSRMQVVDSMERRLKSLEEKCDKLEVESVRSNGDLAKQIAQVQEQLKAIMDMLKAQHGSKGISGSGSIWQ